MFTFRCLYLCFPPRALPYAHPDTEPCHHLTLPCSSPEDHLDDGIGVDGNDVGGDDENDNGSVGDEGDLPKELLLILLQLLSSDISKLSVLPNLVCRTSAYWRPVQVQAWLLQIENPL